MSRRSNTNQSRDDVLRRMLKTPPAPHKPIGAHKPKPDRIERLAKDPTKFKELARELGQDDPSRDE